MAVVYGVSVITDAGLTAAGVSGVARRVLLLRGVAVKLRLAVNVLTSFCLEIQQ